jgi:hypothetical protein
MSEAEQTECEECCGKGWNEKWMAIAGHYLAGETSIVGCEVCDGTGFEQSKPQNLATE